jgi:hypothetical protein
MPQDRISRIVDAYFHRPQREYLFALSLIKRQGGLNKDEIRLIEARLPHVHASTIIRQAALVSAGSGPIPH